MSCLLLTLLPPELRLIIYQYVLTRSPRTVDNTAKKSRPARNQFRTTILRTCRQIYDEASPILLSANTWVIQPSRADYEWLFGLGPQGWPTLRKIILEADYGSRIWGLEGFHFEIFNILACCTRLDLIITASIWTLPYIYSERLMKYHYGFAKATMNDLVDEPEFCRKHEHLSRTPLTEVVAKNVEHWKKFLDRFTSTCPDNCEMHVGRPAVRTQSTVHLHIRSKCLYC